MKKFLVVLTVIAMLATTAFASISTITKEASQANYPNLLTKGSVLGTDTFVADLPLLSNVVSIDYLYNTVLLDGLHYTGPMGLMVLKTDMGTMGLSVAHQGSPYVYQFFGSNQGLDTVKLMYATGLDAMTLGVSVQAGLDGYSYENKDLVNNTANHNSPFYGNSTADIENSGWQTYGVKVGAAMKGGLDLSVGARMLTMGDYLKFKDAAGVVTEEDNNNTTKLGFNLDGRMPLAGMTTALGVVFNLGNRVDNEKDYTAGTKTYDTTETRSGAYIAVKALGGKDIKATDSLTVKIATGVMFESFGQYNYTSKDNMPGGVTTYQSGTKWSEIVVEIPLNVAIEGKLNETWSINAGAGATLFNFSNTNTKNNATTASEDWKDYSNVGNMDISPALNYAFGVTGKLGDLTLDCHINPYILIAGPQFISGTNSGNLNSSVALSYSWK